MFLAVILACAGRAKPTPAPATCAETGTRYWAIPPSGTRALRVWLDAESQMLDGWRSYGWRRVGFVMEEWNSLRLPVRFVAARSARETDIVIDVIASLPASDDSTDRDQAGVTHLTWQASGALIRARILIAVATPVGLRYHVSDQQANLLHELGHALGLPHATERSAVMAPRRLATSLTGADIALARSRYPRCAPNDRRLPPA